ncbi:hypothetical protein GMOD_00001476 [Pyrenophora seminiperda CCB06]|uniref:Uncharacterized protein n=1 Tax=Pyrenophora seminiperda CCB06 TaxID=1302712 RepID=A0A3M7LZE1_9PLEO|nr:hypothetical protein GMOD_00001476 [Pyrenophora seminiperda CCB06]
MKICSQAPNPLGQPSPRLDHKTGPLTTAPPPF